MGEGLGVAAALQLEAPRIDAARGVHGEDEQEVDRPLRRRAGRPRQRGADEKERDKGHKDEIKELKKSIDNLKKAIQENCPP